MNPHRSINWMSISFPFVQIRSAQVTRGLLSDNKEISISSVFGIAKNFKMKIIKLEPSSTQNAGFLCMSLKHCFYMKKGTIDA